MPYPNTFAGFQVNDAKSWTDFHKNEFEPKPFGDNDVDVKVECCGVCASDLHTIDGSWGNKNYPLAVGHEIVGTVVKVGPKVSLVKEGQRVGVGAQSWSCLKCRQCKNDNETYCKKQLDTYAEKWPGTDIIMQGGYSSHVRAHEWWVFPIPDAIASPLAGPMLCAGITCYSPLARNGCGPGKKVGIVGIGGLGHFGLLFAKVLGAEVWAISRSRSKEADARALGADGFLATNEPGWADAHSMTFDLIINTASSFSDFPLTEYLSLLDVHGRWVSVGLPGDGQALKIRNQDMIPNGCLIGSSHLGSRREMLEMFQLAADKNIKPWVQEVPISAEGLKEALTRQKKHDVRYRICLTNYDDVYGK